MLRVLAFVSAASLIAACSGGGGSSGTTPNFTTGGSSSTSAGTMSVSFQGIGTTGASRSTSSLTGQTVTVKFNGQVVATGIVDAQQHAVLTFTATVPRGATVQVTVGSVTASVVLAMSTTGTVVTVVINPDGTLSVRAHNDNNGEDENEDEDHDGNPSNVTTNTPVLPANLPFTVSANCGQITITATDNRIAFLDFIEKVSDDEPDDDAGARGRIEIKNLAFSTTQNNPLVEPALSSAARFEIRVYDASHHRLVDVKAPLTAVTSTTTNASPCPSSTPTATPTATPAPTATPTSTPH